MKRDALFSAWPGPWSRPLCVSVFPWSGVPGGSSSLKPSDSGNKKAQLTSLHNKERVSCLLQGEGLWPRRRPLARTLLPGLLPRPPRASKRRAPWRGSSLSLHLSQAAGCTLTTRQFGSIKSKRLQNPNTHLDNEPFPFTPQKALGCHRNQCVSPAVKDVEAASGSVCSDQRGVSCG